MTERHPPAPGSFWRISQPNERRTLAFCALGAVIGLLVAGAGLFTARGTRTLGVPAEDAALVNQTPILMSDYVNQLRALYDVTPSEATPLQRRRVLDDMIREELYVQRGVEIGLPADDTDVRRTLVTATEGQATADSLNTLPSEAELRRYHAAHAGDFTNPGSLAVQDWVLPLARGADAPRIADAVRSGAPPASLGLADSGRVKGLEFYWAAELHLGKALFAVARATPPGGVSAPVAQADGVHILVVQQNTAASAERYEDVAPDVLARYRHDAAQRIIAGYDRFVRKRADVRIAPELR